MEACADGVMFTTSIGTGNGDFIQAITTTAEGRIYYPMAVREAFSKAQASPNIADPLSERELEVIRCIIEGMKNLEIAEALFISAKIVKSHVSTVIQKWRVTQKPGCYVCINLWLS